MKTQFTDFGTTYCFCGNQCLLPYETKALSDEPNVYRKFLGQFKFSKEKVKEGILLISKSVVKEMLGADLDIKLIVTLFAGYLSLVLQSLNVLHIKDFAVRAAHVSSRTYLQLIDSGVFKITTYIHFLLKNIHYEKR